MNTVDFRLSALHTKLQEIIFKMPLNTVLAALQKLPSVNYMKNHYQNTVIKLRASYVHSSHKPGQFVFYENRNSDGILCSKLVLGHQSPLLQMQEDKNDVPTNFWIPYRVIEPLSTQSISIVESTYKTSCYTNDSTNVHSAFIVFRFVFGKLIASRISVICHD